MAKPVQTITKDSTYYLNLKAYVDVQVRYIRTTKGPCISRVENRILVPSVPFFLDPDPINQNLWDREDPNG